MLVEVCYLIGGDEVVLWRERSISAAAMPDSRARWAAIWQHREVLVEIAHSHPAGPLAFSAEDLTTMLALDAALGRDIRFSVITADAMLRRERDGTTTVVTEEPAWASLLRADSGLAESEKRWRF